MRIHTPLMMCFLLALAACSGNTLFPGNGTNASNTSLFIPNATNITNATPVSIPNATANATPTTNASANATARSNATYDATVSGVEGQLIQLHSKATDPDGDPVTLSFSAPFNASGDWQTKIGDAGRYNVTVTASDGKTSTQAHILVIVTRANRPPVITGPDVIHVKEGQTVNLRVFTIVDPDGDTFVTSYSGWMQGSTYTTNYNDAGNHTVTIIAEDSHGNQAEKKVIIDVANVNRPPVLSVSPLHINATEGDLVRINASATDPDNQTVKISYGAPFNSLGEWQTTVGDAGDYEAAVTATDGIAQVSKTVSVRVNPANRAPVIQVADTITVKEGQLIDLANYVTVSDPDGDSVNVTYSGWMNSETYTATYNDAGTYSETVRATDGKTTSRKTFTIQVQNVNRAPVFITPA